MDSVGFFFFCIFTRFVSLSSSLNSDGLALLALKAAVTADPTNSLATWSELHSNPCHWSGISCNSDHSVTSISLPNMNLTGYLPSELGAILSLRHLSLSGNNFSKPIPNHLFNATGLLSIDLSHNSLTGPVPVKLSTLKFLTFLDLSSNFLNGTLPESLSNLTHLSGTLNLSHNHFTGDIPASYGLFQVTVSLDLRHNNLTGKIPQVGSLLNQGPTSFAGNPFLCGFPSQTECSNPEAQDLGVLSNPDSPKDPAPSAELPGKEKGGSEWPTVPLISAVPVVIGVMVVSMWVYRKKRRFSEDKRRGNEKLEKQEVSVSVREDEGQDGKFVVMDECFGLELEDLFRASAYVVGKNRSGILYKVVAGRGSSSAVVAVRRLSDFDANWRLREFETEVEIIARVQHPNIVRLRAYYYATDEKLLVSDFVSNGSLYSALHDKDRVADPLPPLAWPARLRIAQGVARGLAHIHECSPRKYVHGSLKSSKILLDSSLQPFISGFGLHRLMSTTSSKCNSRKHNNSWQPTITTAKDSASSSSPTMYYVAPEARISGHKLTTKCDVYSFGIVLLEILTGRAPDGGDGNDGKGLEGIVRKAFREGRKLSEVIDPTLLKEVNAKKQVVATFHIALSCTELDPEVRPKMRMVSDSLDRIKLH